VIAIEFKRIRAAVPAVAALIALTQSALGQAFTVTCAAEDVVMPGWNSPLTVTYTGGESGEMTVKSDHVAYTVPARQSEQKYELDGKELTATNISGVGEVPSVMPDAQALLECAAKSLQPEYKNDKDMQALAIMNCVPKVAASSIPVHAEILVNLTPGDAPDSVDVGVQTKRRYLEAKSPSGESIVIETFPKDCKLARP
jgi:hypothetical protein